MNQIAGINHTNFVQCIYKFWLLFWLFFNLENEASVNITNKAGITPLHDAVNRGDIDIAKLLLEYGAAKDIKAKEG